MKYGFKLEQGQVKTLIEMLERCRCEGEDQICVDLRTSVKNQYKSQYEEHQNQEVHRSMNDIDILDNVNAMFGPNHCDDCD